VICVHLVTLVHEIGATNPQFKPVNIETIQGSNKPLNVEYTAIRKPSVKEGL